MVLWFIVIQMKIGHLPAEISLSDNSAHLNVYHTTHSKYGFSISFLPSSTYINSSLPIRCELDEYRQMHHTTKPKLMKWLQLDLAYRRRSLFCYDTEHMWSSVTHRLIDRWVAFRLYFRIIQNALVCYPLWTNDRSYRNLGIGIMTDHMELG